MNKTQYGLELRKPTYTDPVEIGDLNYNMDIIDHAIKKVNDKLGTLSQHEEDIDGLKNDIDALWAAIGGRK